MKTCLFGFSSRLTEIRGVVREQAFWLEIGQKERVRREHERKIASEPRENWTPSGWDTVKRKVAKRKKLIASEGSRPFHPKGQFTSYKSSKNSAGTLGEESYVAKV